MWPYGFDNVKSGGKNIIEPKLGTPTKVCNVAIFILFFSLYDLLCLFVPILAISSLVELSINLKLSRRPFIWKRNIENFDLSTHFESLSLVTKVVKTATCGILAIPYFMYRIGTSTVYRKIR